MVGSEWRMGGSYSPFATRYSPISAQIIDFSLVFSPFRLDFTAFCGYKSRHPARDFSRRLFLREFQGRLIPGPRENRTHND